MTRNPDLTANEIQRRVGARRCDVLRAVKAIGVVRDAKSEERPAQRCSRFPNPRGGLDSGRAEA